MTKRPKDRSGASERRYYVRTVRITVQITQVVITLTRGDETVVIEIPIIG